MNPFLGEIRLFAFNRAPRNWQECNGQLLAIGTNQALFSLLGTYYGGNGVNTFALPDLRGRVPVGSSRGVGPSLTDREIGYRFGTETVVLSPDHLPWHTHSPFVAGQQSSDRPELAGAAPGGSYGLADQYSNISTHPSGGNQAHENMQPSLVLGYYIATFGIFPPRD